MDMKSNLLGTCKRRCGTVGSDRKARKPYKIEIFKNHIFLLK